MKDRPAAPPLKAERRLQVRKSARVELVLRADGRFEVRLGGRALADYASLPEAEDTAERVAGDLNPAAVEEPAKDGHLSPILPRTRRQPYTASDCQWWAENAPTRHDGFWVVLPAMPQVDDFPRRRPGVERGPMRRRPSSGQTGLDDADILAHTASVG